MGYLPVKILEKYGTLQKFPKKKNTWGIIGRIY